jgi:1-acyl-sn-glycerol-3-phosphate acyltransferase
MHAAQECAANRKKDICLTANLNMRPGLFGRFCAALLGLCGWRVLFVPPAMPKAVVIVYPHTSNWDFVVGILARFAAVRRPLPLSWRHPGESAPEHRFRG